MYAKASVQEYWIINLHRSQLEIYRRPESDPLTPSGYRYTEQVVMTAQDIVQPLGIATDIVVQKLLP